jgi:uncharacterized glyoxalase superfamily protein PhnB
MDRKEGQVQHAEISIGGSTIMVSEETESFKAKGAMLYVNVEDTDETFEKATKAGCDIIMEPYDEDYRARSAGFSDSYGNVWWLATFRD